MNDIDLKKISLSLEESQEIGRLIKSGELKDHQSIMDYINKRKRENVEVYTKNMNRHLQEAIDAKVSGSINAQDALDAAKMYAKYLGIESLDERFNEEVQKGKQRNLENLDSLLKAAKNSALSVLPIYVDYYLDEAMRYATKVGIEVPTKIVQEIKQTYVNSLLEYAEIALSSRKELDFSRLLYKIQCASKLVEVPQERVQELKQQHIDIILDEAERFASDGDVKNSKRRIEYARARATEYRIEVPDDKVGQIKQIAKRHTFLGKLFGR